MSLIGIDVGTSAIKVGVYNEAGGGLAAVSIAVGAESATPGEIIADPKRVWTAVQDALTQVAGTAAVRRDPPRALAISASGDEVFPVDAAGEPLGPCLLSADPRGEEIETATQARASVRRWYRECGHLPERMDPVNRILWWRVHDPAVAARAARFLGWHEYLTEKLCGRAVTDHSLASKWAVYDRVEGRWSSAQLAAFALAPETLPEVAAWGTALGTLRPALATQLGLPGGVVVGVGAFDSVCTALGLGVAEPGLAGLACGTWEVLVVPTNNGEGSERIVQARMPIVAYPGDAAQAILWQSPNGSSVAKWAARLVGTTVPLARTELVARAISAPQLIAIPHLFGSVGLWPHARDSSGALLGLTESTTPADAYAALLEGVAFDLALAIRVVESSGVPLAKLRAGGGGTHTPWWMQRKADISGKPVEVCNQSEPGTLGAALLAGVALGLYPSTSRVARECVSVARCFEPSAERACHYAEKLDAYQRMVPAIIELRATSRPRAARKRPAELMTPALVVDLEVFEENAAEAERMFQGSGKWLRPHFKTHRTPGLALRQLSPRVGGFTCATLGEAETLVAAGVKDVLLANEIVSPEKIRAVVALAERARMIVAVDASEPSLALAAEARRQGVVIDVLVDIDVGLDRCGVRGATAARDLALEVARTDGLRFAGIMGYEGRLRAELADRAERSARAFARLAEAKAEIESGGLAVPIVSAAGTSTLLEALRDPTVTEIQAGTYALMEPDLEALGLPFRGAARVIGTVISRHANQLVLDVGRRAVGCDGGLPVPLLAGARTLRVNDEHAVLSCDGELPRLGEHVSLRPTQNRTTFNLHSNVWLYRQGQPVDRLPIAAGNQPGVFAPSF